MSDSLLHLARQGPAAVPGAPTISSPANVIVHAQALFQILDHALRRNSGQQRVIGTLLGVRSEDGLEVEIRSAYGVPHDETEDQVIVAMDHNRSMYQLHRKANPKDVILGWYATSNELNNLSGLVQDFYSQQSSGTYPYPAVHLTVETTTATSNIDVRTYISSPVGVSSSLSSGVGANADKISTSTSSGNCIFVPVPNEVRYSEVEKSALSVLSQAKDDESRSAPLVSDMKALEDSIVEVIDMLQRVSAYVNGILSGTSPANVAIGKYLLKSLSLVPSLSAETLEKLFNSHLQDVLMVVYLANTVKTQLQLSSRLTPLV